MGQQRRQVAANLGRNLSPADLLPNERPDFELSPVTETARREESINGLREAKVCHPHMRISQVQEHPADTLGRNMTGGGER